ncbi:MAG: pyruvate formate lyase family protein [Eubacteriales bacterium]
MNDRIHAIEPYGAAFYENRERPLNIRMALASKESAKYCSVRIDPENYIGYAWSGCPTSGMTYSYGSGIAVDEEKFRENAKAYPELAEELETIRDYVRGFNTGSLIGQHQDRYQRELASTGACWGGGWAGHSNPDYDLLLHLGTTGLREKIAKFRAKNPGKEDFYEGCEIFMDAIDLLGERLHAAALEMAETAESPVARADFLKMAEAYSVIPKKPAYNMRSAVLMFWMVFTFDGIDSPGRLDQFFLDFWRMDDADEAFLQLERLWQCFHDTRTWNLCIGGSDENWNDKMNEVSYAVLDLAEKYKYQTPNITLRVHRNTPDRVWQRAAEVLATGIGMPALYNDEVVCPALEKMGIPPVHSHLYCMNGCNQIDIMGKSHMGLEDGEVNFGKCLEFALYDGFDVKSGRQVSIHTGEAEHFTTFEELMEALKGQVEHVTDVSVSLSNSSQMTYARYAPSPLRSCLLEGCLEKGRDYKNGGPLYGDGQILSEGMPDCVDSLAAVKKFIFEEKRWTMAELIDALKKNFEGYEEMRTVLMTAPKFGNDNPYVDSIMKELSDHWFAYLKTKRTFRGGRFAGGCSTFSRAASNGRACGALPNGHLSGDPMFADCIGAVPGKDVCGPTAAVKSALVYNQTEVTSGFVFQLRFDKKLFATEKGMESFVNLAKAYFAGGGQQMSINVLSAEELREAQAHPENYGDLIVRVGGYSDYFVRLPRDLQDNIIARTNY